MKNLRLGECGFEQGNRMAMDHCDMCTSPVHGRGVWYRDTARVKCFCRECAVDEVKRRGDFRFEIPGAGKMPALPGC